MKFPVDSVYKTHMTLCSQFSPGYLVINVPMSQSQKDDEIQKNLLVCVTVLVNMCSSLEHMSNDPTSRATEETSAFQK